MKNLLYNIELSDEAEFDFECSYNYYNAINQKVADDFLKQIDKSFTSIKKNPLGYSVVYKEVRKSVLKKFPFIVYYKIDLVIIRVIAIFHASRNPEIWKERSDKE